MRLLRRVNRINDDRIKKYHEIKADYDGNKGKSKHGMYRWFGINRNEMRMSGIIFVISLMIILFLVVLYGHYVTCMFTYGLCTDFGTIIISVRNKDAFRSISDVNKDRLINGDDNVRINAKENVLMLIDDIGIMDNIEMMFQSYPQIHVVKYPDGGVGFRKYIDNLLDNYTQVCKKV